MKEQKLISYGDIYPLKSLKKALIAMGNYVYGYYRPEELQPFYVGKGKGCRVLNHWRDAIKNVEDKNNQVVEIRNILISAKVPTIKILAYNLEETEKEEVYSVAERVLEDAFGIQRVWDKRGGSDRLVESRNKATLLQKREDSSKTPVLSLDAVLSRFRGGEEVNLKELSKSVKVPILLVGISKTYHESYSESQLANMARMYWNLDRLKKARYISLKDASDAVLLAWTSKISMDAKPTIVGAWRIKKNSFSKHEKTGRYSFEVSVDYDLKKRCLGVRLCGDGKKYQGPRIFLPDIE